MEFKLGKVPRKKGTLFSVKKVEDQFFSSLLSFPYKQCDPYIASLLFFSPLTPAKQERYINSLKIPPMFQRELWSSHTHRALREEIYKVNGIRFQLRKLLQIWRWKKLLPRNDEDIVSGEAPKYPIYIVDWEGNQVWVYEASTLMRDITNRLMNHDVFFECCQRPRNPLTNLPLTYSQKISVWNQFTHYPILQSKAFTAYRSARFNIYKFITENRTHILLHALRQSMKIKGDFEVNDRILDFIRYAHDAEGEDYSSPMYTFLLLRYPEHSIMIQWRQLCTKYHELELLYPNMHDKLVIEQDRILDSTTELIAKRLFLMNLWHADRNLTS